jgi:hypothetical protein
LSAPFVQQAILEPTVQLTFGQERNEETVKKQLDLLVIK